MKKVCGAKKRNKNERCKAQAMANGRCRIHGGKTPNGFASPHYKTGEHSKYLRRLMGRTNNEPAELSNKLKQSLSYFAKQFDA